MCKLQECVAAENLVTYTAAFEAQHVEFVATNEQVQEFLIRFNPPPEVVVPDPVALTVANAEHWEDITQDLVDILDDAEGSLEQAPSPPLHAHVENLLRAVEEKLNQVFISTRESAILDPNGHAAVLPTYQSLKRSVLARVRKARERMSTSPIPACLLYTSPSPRDQRGSRMPSSA